jgi:hypothetical protein
MRAWVVLAMVSAATPAHADSKLAADAFERGRKLVAAGNTAEACQAFFESLHAEFSYATLYQFAGCEETLGKVATAWQAFHQLAAEDSDLARRAKSAERADALLPRVPKLAITVEHAPPNTAYTLDGERITLAAGEPVLVDPGEHVLVARAPGYREQRLPTGALVAGARRDLVVALEATGASLAVKPEPDVKLVRHRTGHRTAAYVTIAGGVAVIGASVGLGFYEKSQYDQALGRMDYDGANHARDVLRDIGTPMFVLGLVALPVGFVLYARSNTVVITAAPTDRAGVAISGRF